MALPDLASFDRLPASERIQLLEELWDRIADRPDDVEVTPAQLAELERRVDGDDAEPDAALPWHQVRAQLLSRR